MARHTQNIKGKSNPPFTWSTPVSYEVFPYLAGIPLRLFHLEPSACVKSFRLGREALREIFGDDIPVPACYCPPLSYGHIACLGTEVLFPENGAPGVRPVCSSIDEGIRVMRAETVFENNELFKLYLRMQVYLQKEFPEEKVAFSGFGWEGPITSAVLLRGQDFYVDLYDYPEKAKEFLNMLTTSIIRFTRFCATVNSDPEVSPRGGGLCDDFAALIPPDLWPEFVLPYWDQYYKGITTGSRSLHCEDLSPAHLKYLKTLNVASFDPDKSSKLSPTIIARNTEVPFAWSLQSYEYACMTIQDVEDWVLESVAGGASRVYSYIYVNMCEGSTPAKVRSFIETAGKESGLCQT